MLLRLGALCLLAIAAAQEPPAQPPSWYRPVHGVHLTGWGAGSPKVRRTFVREMKAAGLNAVVIALKEYDGYMFVRGVPLAHETGAFVNAIPDLPACVRDFREAGIYAIARIVLFKDNHLARRRPDLAVRQSGGGIWTNAKGVAWVDPYRRELWDYNLDIAVRAAEAGFDEIQFDYVRFPTDGRLSAARYSKPNNQATRIETVAGFLAKAKRELGPTGVFLAADVFGYTAFNENDTDIGQRIEEMAPHLDYISPMVYPSGYHRGIPGFRNPVEHPYEIVRESVRLIRKRSTHATVQVRPWIQDFRDYAFDRRIFGVKEIRAQMRGADEAGGAGWMLWNPRNDYTAEALRSKPVVARTPDS